MLGRGIDQILPHPSDPILHEPCITDARDYVRLAEQSPPQHPIPRNVPPDYIWGDALPFIQQADARIINLETAITTSPHHWLSKDIHYRMHPANIDALRIPLGPDGGGTCCSLANNHLLDWGHDGLTETLATLDRAHILHAGAGPTLNLAQQPAILPLENSRLLIFAMADLSSGPPQSWAATPTRPGIHLLPDLSPDTARTIAARARQFIQPNDLLLASIHWGPNWGLDIPDDQITFAHTLIDLGFSLVLGHSSHHVKPLELYRNHLILYGAGDLLTDYEGIPDHAEFRPDLSLLYLATLNPKDATLTHLRLIPTQLKSFRLTHPTPTDLPYLHQLLTHPSVPFQTPLTRSQNEFSLTPR